MKYSYELPPGIYFIGDPSLLFFNDQVWLTIINEVESFSKKHFAYNDHGVICACSTPQQEYILYNDQVITGRKKIVIQSGLLGVSSLIGDEVKIDESKMNQLHQQGFFIQFKKPFQVAFESFEDKILYELGDVTFLLDKNIELEDTHIE